MPLDPAVQLVQVDQVEGRPLEVSAHEGRGADHSQTQHNGHHRPCFHLDCVPTTQHVLILIPTIEVLPFVMSSLLSTEIHHQNDLKKLAPHQSHLFATKVRIPNPYKGFGVSVFIDDCTLTYSALGHLSQCQCH